VAAYCAKADLIRRFGAKELAELTDETAAHSSDDDEITDACDEASSLIDSYLSTRYTVPLDPAPTMVRKWACDLARKDLWKDRAGPDSVVTLNAEAAMSQLKDVAKGLSGLPGADGSAPIPTGGIAYTTPTTVFNTDGLL
jgi:phage gp36-like protein